MNIGVILVETYGRARAEFARKIVDHLKNKGHHLYLIGNDPFDIMPDSLENVSTRVEFESLLAVSDQITGHHYLLSNHENQDKTSVFVYSGSALPHPLHLILTVVPYECVSHLPLLPEAHFIPYPKQHRKHGSGVDLPKSQDGLVWFGELLEEYMLTSLETPELFLSELIWQKNLRLRKETFGGILFVPKTSQLVLLNKQMYQQVENAIENDDTLPLLTQSSHDVRWIASMLTARALVRRDPA